MRTFFTILFFGLLQAAQAQTGDTFPLLRSYPGPAAGVQLDNLGNLYLVSREGGVKKLGPGGDSVAVYNGVRQNGRLHTLDVSNPLKLLLFYKDFAQVAVLDRFLSLQLTLNLRRSGIMQPAAVGSSYDNKIWVFDALANKLKKLDDGGNILLETPDLRAVFPGGIMPQQIMDHNKWVYLYDPVQGLFQFDYYGNFKRKMPIEGWSNLLITGQYIYGIKDGMLQSYSVSTLMQEQRPLPDMLKACTGLYLGVEKLAALCNGGVSVFSWR